MTLKLLLIKRKHKYTDEKLTAAFKLDFFQVQPKFAIKIRSLCEIQTRRTEIWICIQKLNKIKIFRRYVFASKIFDFVHHFQVQVRIDLNIAQNILAIW